MILFTYYELKRYFIYFRCFCTGMSLITNYEYWNMNIKTLTRSNKIYLSIYLSYIILLKHVIGVLHILIKTRLLATKDNYIDEFADCTTVDTLSYFHILSNESLTFNYIDQCEVELNLNLEDT
jgi:hypothetical protein